jgi:hypothetical protein
VRLPFLRPCHSLTKKIPAQGGVSSWLQMKSLLDVLSAPSHPTKTKETDAKEHEGGGFGYADTVEGCNEFHVGAGGRITAPKLTRPGAVVTSIVLINELTARVIVTGKNPTHRGSGEPLKGLLHTAVERIDLDPTSLECRIHYRIGWEGRHKVASPRGFEPLLPP